MINTQKIQKAGIYLFLIASFSSILGFVREILIADRFGASATTDSFLIAITPISILIVIAQSTTTPFITIFSKKLLKSKKEAWDSGSKILTTVSLLSFIFAVIYVIFAPFFVKLIAPGLSAESTQLAILLTRIGFPALALLAPIYLTKGVYNSLNHFTLPELSSLAPNIGIIIALFYSAFFFGIKGVMAGLALGYVIYFLIPFLKSLPVLKENFHFKVSFDPEMKRFLFLVLVYFTIYIGLNIDMVVDKIFASEISQGAISSLNFARKIADSFSFNIGFAVATVILPTLTQHLTLKNNKEFNLLFQKSIKVLALVLLPVSVLVFILRVPLVSLLFERGLFSPEATIMTANILAFYAVGLFSFAVILVLARVVCVIEEFKIPILISLSVMVVNIILDYFLVKSFSYQGLAAATLVAALLNTLLLFLYLHKKIGILKNSKLGIFTGKLAVLLSLIAGSTIFLKNYLLNFLNLNTIAEKFVYLSVIVGISTLIFFVFAYLLRFDELKFLRKLFVKRINQEEFYE